MPCKAVIFDLDGTLVNSLEDLADSVNKLLNQYGYPVHSIETYRYFVGNGSRKLIERALPLNVRSESLIDEALSQYKQIYEQNLLRKTKPYDGIPALLQSLAEQSIPLAICTNKHQQAADKIVNSLFAPHTFCAVHGDYPGNKRKPDPSTVLQIVQKYHWQPADVAYLGDSMVDMQTAVQVGCLPVGVLWGFREQDELCAHGAKILLKHPMELLQKVTFCG